MSYPPWSEPGKAVQESVCDPEEDPFISCKYAVWALQEGLFFPLNYNMKKKIKPNLRQIQSLTFDLIEKQKKQNKKQGSGGGRTDRTTEALEAAPPCLICTQWNSVFTAFLLSVFRQRTCPIAHGPLRCWWMDDCGITSLWKTNHPNRGEGEKHLAASRKTVQKPPHPHRALFQRGRWEIPWR